MSQAPELTPASVHRLMQNNNINQLTLNYKAFLDSLNNMPMAKHCSDRAIYFLETGFIWLKEAINSVPTPQVTPPQPTTQAATPTNDATVAEAPAEAAATESSSLPADAA